MDVGSEKGGNDLTTKGFKRALWDGEKMPGFYCGCGHTDVCTQESCMRIQVHCIINHQIDFSKRIGGLRENAVTKCSY